MSDELLPVLDELERRLIAGCYDPPSAAPARRGRRRFWRIRSRSRARRLPWHLAGPALALAVSALVVTIVVNAALRHTSAPHVRRVGGQQPPPGVVRNYAHSALPPLPRGSVTYYRGHLGTRLTAPRARDTFALSTTQVAYLHHAVPPTRSVLTIEAHLRAAPRGSVYAVWLSSASYTGTSVSSMVTLPPYTLVGVVQPPVGGDGELVVRAPISVVVQGPVNSQFALLITLERGAHPTRPGRTVLAGVIS